MKEVNMNRLLKASRLLKKLTGKLRSRFVPKEISRKQLNITIDNKLILGLKFAAKDLGVPTGLFGDATECYSLKNIDIDFYTDWGSVSLYGMVQY